MLELWIPLLLGWPAIIIALLLSLFGIIRRKPRVLIASAILVLPISFYLLGSPRIGWLGLLIPFLFVGVGMAIYRKKIVLAWSLLVPYIAVFSWLAVVVIKQ
jgi:hypothetical protein